MQNYFKRVEKHFSIGRYCGIFSIKYSKTQGGLFMAYESKVILVAIGEIMARSNSLEDAYKAVRAIANAEGVVLKTLAEKKKEIAEEEKTEGDKNDN